MKISTKVVTSLVTPLLLLGSNVALSASAPTGFILMRAYVPAGDNPKNVSLPSLTFEYGNGTSKVVKPCLAPVGVLSEIANYFTTNEPKCAWFLAIGGERILDPNFAFPDSVSTYWVTQFVPMEDNDQTSEKHLKRIVIKGEYPKVRYFSFNTYVADGSKPLQEIDFKSSLPDYSINPDSGFVNPWQGERPRFSPLIYKPTYTVNVVRSSDYNPTTSSLVMPPAQYSNFRDMIGNMPQFNCATAEPGSGEETLCKNEGFARPRDTLLSSVFPNHDSAYLINIIKPDINTVWVINGKLPRTVKGDSAVIWPDYTKYDVRYFSICNQLMVKPYPLVDRDKGCVRDEELTLRDGRYTVVVGDVIPKIGHNQLPVSNLALNQYNGVLVRNMVADPQFGYSTLKVKADNEPSSASSTMGAYYPQIKKCTKVSYLLKGADCKY